MSTKLKVLGMGLLAMLATSAFAVMNAGAETTGHFESSVAHTTIVGTESGTHTLHFRDDKLKPVEQTEYIGCEVDKYEGTANAVTVESITITPTYEKCQTTNEAKTALTVDPNGCQYTFTVTRTAAAPEHPDIKAKLLCPAGVKLKITHPNCTISIGEQLVPNAGTYTTITENGKHALTLNVKATFAATYHGLCQFLTATNSFGELIGSVTVKGLNTAGEQVNITAT